MAAFADLVGKTLTTVVLDKGDKDRLHWNEGGNDAIKFITGDGKAYIMTHYQDCCESVGIEDITGDLNWLVGSPVLVAYEDSKEDPDASEHGTWTFYRIATVNGVVVIRWHGDSNGYYSESAGFYEV